MTEAELLTQRFIDQELSADERIRFVARLVRDAALRDHVIDLERVLMEVADLDHPAPSPGFAGAVMERIDRSPGGRRRFAAAVWRPRQVRWSIAGALAAACVFGLALWGALAVGRTWGTLPAVTSQAADSRSQRVLVRLLVVDASARTVEVAGDFNNWEPARTPLERVSGDGWAVTVALAPGRYEYMFVIDGNKWVADPFAAERSSDGFGSENAVLDVNVPVGAPL